MKKSVVIELTCGLIGYGIEKVVTWNRVQTVLKSDELAQKITDYLDKEQPKKEVTIL